MINSLSHTCMPVHACACVYIRACMHVYVCTPFCPLLSFQKRIETQGMIVVHNVSCDELINNKIGMFLYLPDR